MRSLLLLYIIQYKTYITEHISANDHMISMLTQTGLKHLLDIMTLTIVFHFKKT